MASVTVSERNDEADLALSWSGRWTLAHRILAVNLLTLVLVALAIFFLDAYRNRLEKERVQKVEAEAEMAATALQSVPPEAREELMASFSRQNGTRIRVYAAGGELVLDSWRLSGPTYRLRDPERGDRREGIRKDRIRGSPGAGAHPRLFCSLAHRPRRYPPRYRQ